MDSLDTMRRVLLAVLALLTIPVPATAAPGVTNYPLPTGFRPEGIAIQRGFAYHGGSPSGAIIKVDVKTGKGTVLGHGTGTPALGLKIDDRGRIFVAGGRAGDFRVVDSRDGTILANYSIAPAGDLVNDVFLTEEAAYVTNSDRPEIYRLPLGRRGELPTQAQIEKIPLSGDIVFSAGVNSNGITTTSDGRTLLMAQSNAGKIFQVDPRTGVTKALDLGGEVLTWADGLLRSGRTLYVVQNRLNTVAELRLNHDATKATLIRKITDPSFDVPTNVVLHKGRLWLPNARLTTPLTPETTYNVVSVPRPGS